MSDVRSVVTANWDSEVLGSEKPVLVDFWADWCGPCHRLAPIVDKIAAERAEVLDVVKLDVDANTDVAVRHQVSAMPTLLVFSGGKEIGRMVGALPKSQLDKALDEALASIEAA